LALSDRRAAGHNITQGAYPTGGNTAFYEMRSEQIEPSWPALAPGQRKATPVLKKDVLGKGSHGLNHIQGLKRFPKAVHV
jgi:hypothetical protein